MNEDRKTELGHTCLCNVSVPKKEQPQCVYIKEKNLLGAVPIGIVDTWHPFISECNFT